MYSRRQSSKEKSSQKKLKSSSLFTQCQKVISELQAQLQHSLQINEQKDKMIKILTEQKQYYMNESKSTADKKYAQLKQQINWNNSLINGLKKHNKQITQKYQSLLEQNSQISSELRLKEDLLNAQSIQIQKIKIQKDKIQSQWNRTLLNVKQKIIQLYRNNQVKIQAPKKPITKNQQRPITKQQNSAKKSSQTLTKVQEILNELDQKIISYEVQDLIKNQYFQNKNTQHLQDKLPMFQKNNMNMNMNIDTSKLNLKNQKKMTIEDIVNFDIENKENVFTNSNVF